MSDSRGVYVIENGGVIIATAITIIQLKAGPNMGLELIRAKVSQGIDETSAMEVVQLLRKSAAATVTSRTALKLNPGDPVADAVGGTAATGITGTAEGTDGDVLVQEGFNTLSGWEWVPTPSERIFVKVAGIIALKFPTAPASKTWHAAFYFKEIG